MVEVKNPIKEANAHPEKEYVTLWRTKLAYFWVIHQEPNVQDDMHYHENDDHIFTVLQGECTIRTPRGEFIMSQFDTVLLESGEVYQVCNTGTETLILLGAGNGPLEGKTRTRVPRQASHLPVSVPIPA